MTIQSGDKIPSISVKRMGANGLEDFNLADAIAGKTAVIFGVPGAFTPTCAQKHLPGYIDRSAEIRAQGVDEIFCLSVNDPFVMKQWGDTAGANGKVTMVADGNGELTRAMGLEFDGSGAGLGTRAKRFVMRVENGVVRDIQIENSPGDLSITGADVCAANLKKAA